MNPTIQRFEQLEELNSLHQPVHLALGVFDGVHVGHQAVIKTAVEAAKKTQGIAGVLTFFPHPIQVLAPTRAPKRILASLNSKAYLLEKLNCSFLMVQEFSPAFAQSRARDFIEKIVNNVPKLRTISVGEDWQFGKGREGNVESLTGWGKEMGFEVFATPPVMRDGERVSSTRIRQAIRDGCLTSIEKLMGRPYMVRGQVIEGRKLARKLGYPTANIKVFNEQLPPDGVWSVRVKIAELWHEGIGNLGKRPTLETDANAQRLLEIHVFDFEGNLYDAELLVQFCSFVRTEKQFSDIEELKQQIKKDVEQVKKEKKE